MYEYNLMLLNFVTTLCYNAMDLVNIYQIPELSYLKSLFHKQIWKWLTKRWFCQEKKIRNFKFYYSWYL